MFDVVEYTYEHLILRRMLRMLMAVVAMRAIVNDAVHVEVKVVELGDAVFGNELGDGWISLGHPAKEFGDTYVSDQYMCAHLRSDRWM